MSDLVQRLDGLLDQFTSRLGRDPLFGAMLSGTIMREPLIGVYTEIWHCLRETPHALRAAGQSIALYAGAEPRYSGEEYARFKTPFYARLRAEFRHHTEEETGHDDWMKSDLCALGVPAEVTERSQPGPAMTAYLALIRHAARSRAPVGVWGQAYLLEGIASTFWPSVVRAMLSGARVPNIDAALSCIRGHLEADVEHRDEARRRLAALEHPHDQEAILFNARATIETWGELSQDVLRAMR